MIPVPVEAAKSSNVVMVSGKVRINKKDFIATENYNLRLRVFGAKKVANEFSNMMKQGVSYGDKQTTWRSILLLKTRELAHYLVGKTKGSDFASPKFGVQRVDSQEIRQKILKISYSDWKKLGFSKRALHYMKQNAKNDKPFSLNSHVLESSGLGEFGLREIKLTSKVDLLTGTLRADAYKEQADR